MTELNSVSTPRLLLDTASDGQHHMIKFIDNGITKYVGTSFGTLSQMISSFYKEDWPGCTCKGCQNNFKVLQHSPNHKINY